jgi:hypothetical protein
LTAALIFDSGDARVAGQAEESTKRYPGPEPVQQAVSRPQVSRVSTRS